MPRLDPITRQLYQRSPAHRVIVLMYHGTPAGSAARPYATPAKRFAEQLDFLKATGWTTAVLSALGDPARLSPKTVLITFDDGYKNNYQGAFLPLLERGMRATWFVVSGRLGRRADWLAGPDDDSALMDGRQVRDLAEAGMEVGSHSHDHLHLEQLDQAAIAEQLVRSKAELEALLGRKVEAFAYPYGTYDDRVVGEVERAGYRFACTTRSGWWRPEESALLIRRVTLFGDENLGSFARKLTFADNEVGWGRVLRYYSGRLRARVGRLLPSR
ncbi:polysaccharide deacetylase family protein [Candidatus Methylocalor cossyra]|uniref:Polysaccharide deacetylase family protein n=1 Tax=Candidatus Methylocalor cossyra TaxID=3108543 RepID=A0ABM9NFW1_9GAMM